MPGFDAGSIVARLELNAKQWEQSIDRIKGDQKKLSGYVLRNEQGFKNMGKAVAVAGAAIVASFGAMIVKTANLGDEINDLSQRTGISAELLSSFKLAADKSGSSLEGFATGMKGLSRAMFDANDGLATSKEAFDKIGVAYTDSTGKLRPLNDVMLEVADRFKAMPDGAEKSALAMRLFGKSGIDLIPMLNLGRAGLEKEADAARKLGLIFSKESAKACDDFNDSLTELKGGLQGVGVQIGNALMPVVKGLVDGATTAITKIVAWTKTHEDLTRVLGTTALGLGSVMTILGPMLLMLPGLIKGWQGLAAALRLSTAALAASVAGLTALVAAAAVAYDTVTRLTNAKNAAVDADFAAFESNQKLGQKLREVADAAGLTRAEFHQLTLKYDENNAALAMAIKRGTEGKALQEALVKVGKEHAAVVDQQRKAHESLNPPLATTARIIDEVLVPAANAAHLALAKMARTISLEVLPKTRSLNDLIDDFTPALIDMSDHFADIPAAAEPAVTETRDYFAGLFNDIAMGFGNTIQSWLSGALTFKDFMLGLWGDIKNAFFRMIGEMIARWVVNFIGSLVSSAATGAVSIAASLGGAIASLGAMAAGIAAGIGAAIVTLATAIASAATIIAAAAPAIIVTSLLALGIDAGLKLLQKIFGGGGKQTDVTYWLKLQWELQQNMYNIFGSGMFTNFLVFLPDAIGSIAVKFDVANKALYKIVEYAKSAADTLKNLKGAASGAVSYQTELMVVHGKRSDPEIIARASQLNSGTAPRAASGGGQGGARNVTLNISISALDGADVETVTRRKVVPVLQKVLDHYGLTVPAGAVGGAR